MAVLEPDNVCTKQDLADFYDEILPYLGGVTSGGGSGTTDYTKLTNKPSIESITLSGNKTASDLGLVKSSSLSSVATSGSYSDLGNKPQINNTTLTGNLSGSDLGLADSSKCYQMTDTVTGTIDFTAVMPFCDVAEPKTKKQTTLDTIKQKLKTYFDTIYSTAKSYADLTNKPSINSVTLSGNKTSSDLSLQDTIQYSTMPTASADLLNKVVQFIGTTTSSYTHGYYYECISDGQDTPTYLWRQTNVQPSSGGGGGGDGHVIQNSSGVDMPQRDALQFGTGFTVTDNSADSKTIVSLGGATHTYSTTEQVVGTWINGKPIYERTFTGLYIILSWNNQYHTEAVQQSPLVTGIDTLVDMIAIDEADSSRKRTGSVMLDIRDNGTRWDYFAADNFCITSLIVRYTKATPSA